MQDYFLIYLQQPSIPSYVLVINFPIKVDKVIQFQKFSRLGLIDFI